MRQKVSTKPSCPPPSHAWEFSIKEFFWNTKVFSNEIFRYSETKTSTENRDTPPPLIQTFSMPKINETLKDSPLRKFSVLWDKTFSTENLDTPPPLIQFFSIPKINETLKDSPPPPTEIFGTVRQKIFDRKSWYSPPPLIQTFSIPDINETLKDPPLRKFSALWDKKFWTKSRDTPSFA